MPPAHEILSEQFYRWEVRGRGWEVFDQPVVPEPPFTPIAFSFPKIAQDDGRRLTFLSSVVETVSRALGNRVPSQPGAEVENEPEPTPLMREELVELRASLPEKLDIS